MNCRQQQHTAHLVALLNGQELHRLGLQAVGLGVAVLLRTLRQNEMRMLLCDVCVVRQNEVRMLLCDVCGASK